VGEVITPYRNGNDPYAARQHRGIDIAGEVGDSVVAAVGGRVTFAGRAGSSGLTVTVRTADDRYDTSYLHLASLAVRKGGTVPGGGRIGAVGTTGRRSAQRPHLHFGVRDAGTRHAYHDPLAFLPPPPAARRPGGPRGAPAPAPAPVRPAPAPASARPVRAPAGGRAPSGRRAPAPHPRSAPAPSPAPLVNPVPHTRAGLGPAPARRHAQGRAPARKAIPRPSLGPSPAPARSGPAAATRRSPAEPSRTGPDLGWAIACAGLLLAAALLGGTQEGRSAASRGRERLAGLLRPLAGRP
jgi:peptidase M23-like protein